MRPLHHHVGVRVRVTGATDTNLQSVGAAIGFSSSIVIDSDALLQDDLSPTWLSFPGILVEEEGRGLGLSQMTQHIPEDLSSVSFPHLASS